MLCIIIFAFASESVAQEKLGVKSVIGSASSKIGNLNHTLTLPVNGIDSSVTINSVSMLVGMTYMGITRGVTIDTSYTQNYLKDLGFPWGVRYLYNTFGEDAFTVSKGYFSDKIEVNWDIKKNLSKITGILVFRTEDITSAQPIWGNPIKTLASDARTYIDNNVEGGKLYRYKIFAQGVEADRLEVLYSNYIVGIGYRNPTGVVTGNISFSGGNPVKDVFVVANPTGSTLRFGSSIKVPANSYVSVNSLHKGLMDSITLQTWMKPVTNFDGDELTLYTLLGSNVGESLAFKVRLVSGVLTASVGQHNISLSNYIPNGQIDNKGDDVLIPIDALNSSFNHFSVVIRDNKIPEIYINGRLISAVYAGKMNSILAQNPSTATSKVTFTSTNTALKVNLSSLQGKPTWLSFRLGGGEAAYFDEFRVWETALSSSLIKRDYSRYLKGNEAFLNTYIRANEKVGDFAYDLAHTGFIFHGNDAKLSNSPIVPTWANSEDDSQNIPTSSQLGVLGVTDEFGNYEISSVPFNGDGNSFTIVPSLGKHEFNPKQKLAFLGVGSTVLNNVDFIDQSSFIFNGLVVYDSRGVFPATSDASIIGDIKDDEAYNAYTIGNRKYQKGEYWAEKDTLGNIIKLNRYATIPLPGAYVNIDNAPVIDANNVPVQTDINGRFQIEVPIGKHAISVTKSNHSFAFEGRFPARTVNIINGDTIYTNTYEDFFEDRDEAVTFIDTTKVIVVGRVVGGMAQAEKPIGFGFDGRKTYTYKDAAEIERKIIYTSENNIGTAQLTLGYLPSGATSITPEYKTNIRTNSETGEYRVKLLPLNYILSQNDLTFLGGKSPDNKPLLDEDKIINFTAVKGLQYPTFVNGSQTITGSPYQEVLKFTYVASPVYKVISQTSDSEIIADGKKYKIASSQYPLIYSQFADYKVEIQGQETYINSDIPNQPIISIVPVKGGSIIATNNLAQEGSEKFQLSTLDSSILIYTFKGGTPNTDQAAGFKRNIDFKYRFNGIDNALIDYKAEGIILGGVADGTQTFVTRGPELPDFVLRDPPGSGSSATIEKGSSFSFSKENSSGAKNGTDLNATVSLGFKLALGGGLAGPVMETEVTNDLSTGVSMVQTSSNGKAVTNTYTFNQTISTNQDPSWIGSDADLYIGTSANQFYGTYNELHASIVGSGPDVIKVLDDKLTALNLYPKIKKALYFKESPEKTVFIYSQHNILNEIIPRYLDFVNKIDSGQLIENTDGVLTKSAYLSSVNLWRRIILNNEFAKYQALNDKDKLKKSLDVIIETLRDPVTKNLSPSEQQLSDLLNGTFFENISFDAGLGGLTKSFQTDRLTSSTLSYQIELDASVGLSLGASFNKTGFEMVSQTNSGSQSANSSGESISANTNISYTLKDSDEGNLFSVDVINAFDGNGPIFITKGGESSCPYEGPDLTLFYNPVHPNVKDTAGVIVNLPENQRVPLSVATIPLEIPEISVQAADVSGIFDGRNAEFILKLRNTSTVNKSAIFKLRVDQSSNPDNAAINIEPNGTLITIPAGVTVSYTMTLKKVKQDQFDYKKIRIILESSCDATAVDEIFLSASFIPACSPVGILAPSNNWLLNRNTAFDSTATKPVYIKLGDYNTGFASLQKISLEYRLKGTPNWIGLRTYYRTQDDFNIAKARGEDKIEVIAGVELNFAWDIAALGLANGNYELRARTSCNNQTSFESEIIEGKVDLTAPVLFGTPTPKNGILNLGDDITLRFSEPIKTNATVTQFEFLVQQNQLPVMHEVSLAFNGANNKASIEKPAVTSGDFSIEFWLKNSSAAGSSTLLSQSGGLKVELIDSEMKYTIGGQTISARITNDSAFNYYALSYDALANKLTIIENSNELKSIAIDPIHFTNEKSIVLGGNSFKGNLHDLRFWKKYISREMAVVNMNSTFRGNESGLLGYWPLNEGNGTIGNDLARFKHLFISNANWDISPKGTAYSFDGTNYLNLAKANNVIISKEMDATISFWMKTNQTGIATLLSNGKADSSDAVASNGYRNRWAINLNAAGGIELQAESKKYAFGSIKVNNDSWHHIALSLTRSGTVRMYIDGEQIASYASIDFGGFYGNSLVLGASGPVNSLDKYYMGQLDELCIWKMARSTEQIKTDQYFEVDYKSTGLVLYSNFNKKVNTNLNGPLYFYENGSGDKISEYAELSGKPIAFTDIAPGVKPFRPTESIRMEAVINSDQIVLQPAISDWAKIEGKVAYITVSNLNDLADNRQLSPITWSAYINKNPTKWFVEGQGEVVKLMKRANEDLMFEITLVNEGGQPQPYSIDLPNWLTLSSRSGTISPNTAITLKATVDNNLAIGNYNTILSLTTNYGFNRKIQLDLRVLEKEPVLNLDPSKFSQSMNIIGKLKIGSVFSNDLYDKVVAIVDGEVRGYTSLIFDAALNEYFVFLTVYSNKVSDENIVFFIWDASDGKLKEATLNEKFTIPFIEDDLIGSYSNPAVLTNTAVIGQQILFNQGWTWTSFNVTDTRFNNLNSLTKNLLLSTSDLILSNSPALFDAYQVNPIDSTENGWTGTVSNNGGISTSKMYKIKLSTQQKLNIKGVPVDLNTWFFNLNKNWNWLPYVVTKNKLLDEALANYKASDGDIIKSQSSFAIYTQSIGWKGTLTYLKAGEGYMLKTSEAQRFTYPAYLDEVNTAADKYLNFDIIEENLASKESVIQTKGYQNFAGTMSVIVKLPYGFKDLYFYNQAGQLRGSGQAQNINGTDLVFVTIYGDKSEILTASIGPKNNIQATAKTINFSADAVIGTIERPLVIELLSEEMTVFPNPFSTSLDVAFVSKEAGPAKIVVFNMLNQKVFESGVNLKIGDNLFKIQPNVLSGSYIVQVRMANKTVFKKIVKN